MINVNWQKIKPYEKKSFALPVIISQLLILIISVILGAYIPPELCILKFLTGVFLFLSAAFDIKIESRMLQIYLLLGILDISFLLAALLPVPKGLTIFFFVISAIVLAVSAAASAAAGILLNKGTAYDSPEPDRSELFGSKSVMLFAPHEDDEINIYGGIIEQYIKNGSEVRIVFSTNGDFHRLGKLRITEALRVAKKYGIPHENIIFLGYSDSLTDKKGLHIYNAGDDEPAVSSNGIKETYGNKAKPQYRSCRFTRKNILDDFKSVILDYKPDILFCCDYDGHSDHRAISLFFEEALDSVLKVNPAYRPEVFKGFAYSTAWDGKCDYYSLNAPSTHLKNPSEYMTETNVYAWADRVRFPVAKENLSRVMQNSSSYMAMMEYSSQTATDHANGILNSDKIFWKRRTDNLLLNAQVTATSGNPNALGGFKLVDSADIKNNPGLPLDNVWTADITDSEKIVAFRLPAARKISCIAIYESPDTASHITSASIILGSVRFETGELKRNGAATIFTFPAVTADIIAVKINSYFGSCSLLKIEAFEEPESEELQLIKLQNLNEDFCYDYIIGKAGKEDFSVYSYPHREQLDFTVECDNDSIRCMVNDGIITVNCPENEKGILTVRAAENDKIYDSVLIRNADERERYVLKLKQRLEQKVLSYPMQWDYYRGLLRRLLSYK